MAPEITVRILTEAGSAEGLGHLVRCVALYDAFAERGCHCRLVVEGEAPMHVVGEREVRVDCWRSSEAACAAVEGADIAVIDSYHADTAVYAAVAEQVRAAVYLDDTARLPYPAGFVVNGNPEASALPWDGAMEATPLLGITYQLLRREFVGLPLRATRPHVSHILVVAGGTDATGVGDRLVSAAGLAFPGSELDTVSEPRSAEEMRDAMLSADVALSAAGQTLYELAATGTPTVALAVADNQVPQARALERAGALLFAGSADALHVEHRLTEACGVLNEPTTREKMSVAAARLVDGRGAERVVRHAMSTALIARIRVRRARQSDESFLLQLANDPVVRSASFSTAQITPDEHHAWLTAKLASRDSLMLVAEDGERQLAQVRFDVQGVAAVVSLAVSMDYRGSGVALPVLQRALHVLAAAFPEVREVVARVRPENTISRGLFENAGFRACGQAEESVSYCWTVTPTGDGDTAVFGA